MNYDTEIQYRMQPCSKVEDDGKIKLLPMSQEVAQDVLTDIVMQELMSCKTVVEAREIERNLHLIAEYTDMQIVRYIGQVQATIKRLEQK
ncbi:hypothetical protein KY333_01280 [Candidatus Woesearchaeota archaeon]|nr:hypothetical protein [Candidatus Woesearchaeota archaeon]